MAETKEPTTGPQAQAQQQTQQAPASNKTQVKGPDGQKGAANKAAAPPAKPKMDTTPVPKRAPEVAKPVAPVLVLRSDPAVFDTNNVKSLVEKRRRLSAARIDLVSKLSQNDLEWRETEEKLRFLLAPSPIFTEGAIPGSEFLTQRLDVLAEAIGAVKALVNDKPTEVETAMAVERVLAPKFEAIAEGRIPVAPDVVPKEDEVLDPDEDEAGQQGDEADDLFDEDEMEEAPFVEATAPDFPWTDAYQVEGAPDMEALPLDVLTLDGVGSLTIVAIPHEASNHIDAFGAELMRKDGEERATVYIRFKQKPKQDGRPWRISEMYRYSVLDPSKWATLVDIAVRRIAGGDKTASIGSFIENEVKALHEKGLIGCQRLDSGTGTWVSAMTRAERQAAKAGGPTMMTAATTPAMSTTPAAKAAQVVRPAQPRTVPAGQRIGGLGEAMKAAQVKRPAAPTQGGGDPLDESFM